MQCAFTANLHCSHRIWCPYYGSTGLLPIFKRDKQNKEEKKGNRDCREEGRSTRKTRAKSLSEPETAYKIWMQPSIHCWLMFWNLEFMMWMLKSYAGANCLSVIYLTPIDHKFENECKFLYYTWCEIRNWDHKLIGKWFTKSSSIIVMKVEDCNHLFLFFVPIRRWVGIQATLPASRSNAA